MKSYVLACALAMFPSAPLLASGSSNDSDLALKELSREIALEETAKTSATESEKSSDEIRKYLDEESGYQLYRNDELRGVDEKNQFESSLRKIGIVDTARSFGSQAALHWRYKEINKIIEKYSGRLDAVNFRPFMTDKIILSPSVLIVRDDEHYLNDRKMIRTNISFVIDDEARIVSVPPNYRDYLVREYAPPKSVNPILRPKNEFERKLWEKGLAEGWAIGVEDAFAIFKDGLLRMERDLQGRVNYRKLVELGMVSPAALKITESGVTFNGRTMNVGETIYEISQDAQYKSMDEWRSAWLKAERTESENGD